MKTERGPIVEIIWYDAAVGEGDYREISNLKPKDFLVKSRSYGQILAEDDWGIILGTNLNGTGEYDYLAIPHDWIKKRRNLNG